MVLYPTLQSPSYFPRCHPLSPPRTPHVTPPTPVGPSTPPAAPKQVAHRRFRLWSAPNPASAPRCSPLFVASPQYTLNPRSAVGPDPRRPPMPEFPAVSFSEPCAFGLPFSAFPRLGKLDFPLMHRRFPQPACVASAPRAFRISAASIPHAPNKPAKALAKARSRHHNVLPAARPITCTEPLIAAATSLALHSPTSLGPHTDQEPTGAHPHSLAPPPANSYHPSLANNYGHPPPNYGSPAQPPANYNGPIRPNNYGQPLAINYAQAQTNNNQPAPPPPNNYGPQPPQQTMVPHQQSIMATLHPNYYGSPLDQQ
ncbi:hypothetical protein PGT21_024346 [Puccinia graminis f. sp. tritici]|uniref:Uncharacterized protein n=1 Tax=Puccinia graminis f. sp. tritici TaxID=56615 RepID=A0A5B0M4R4_PUCGR|nr:hypothetical protein PGT21_024346 [Puccinia graminis f. sp. tritici]